MQAIITKHFRFIVVVSLMSGLYLWHEAAQPEPKHPRLANLWQEIKIAAWTIIGGAAVIKEEPPIDPEYRYQLQPPPSFAYGEVPPREVGDDGHETINHAEGW